MLIYSETSLVRHKNKHGISYSVFPFGSSKQMFLVGEPEEETADGRRQTEAEKGEETARQVRSLLENVKAVCEKEGFTNNVAVMCHFFIADIGMKELVRQLAHKIFPEIVFGAVTFVPQAPASGASIAVELWLVGGDNVAASVEFFLSEDDIAIEDSITIAHFDEMQWFFGGDFRPNHGYVGTYNRLHDTFTGFAVALIECGFRLEQVLRTWIYQGHLLLSEGEKQRYKELNRARTDAFCKTQFLEKYLPKGHKGTVYPASTGIGADDFDVVMSAVALDTKRKDVKVVPLENPNQTSAFDYGAVYSPQSPKFSRAMAVVAGKECLIFVSGTASITDSESRHIENPVKQTEQTLDNIAAVIAGENLARHGISGIVCGLDNLECVRVYVKRPSEVEVIQQVCQRRLPEVPTIYTIADMCRPELLVEIEGIALAGNENRKQSGTH